MISINKKRIAERILGSCLAEQKDYQNKIQVFEKKYQSSFDEFQKKVTENDNESFENWDDYIDWKAYHKLSANIDKMIEDIKHGDFKVV